MKTASIQILDHLPVDHGLTAAGIYYAGLQAKLAPIFGPAETALQVLPHAFQHSRCLTAFADQRLVGLMGLHDRQGGFLSPAAFHMIRHYGGAIGLSRALLLMMLDHKPPPGDLYLDGIAVDAAHRGRGIGTALIRAFERRALENGFRTVSLEVIDSNPRARSLYLRLGYRDIATHSMGPFSRLYGFRTTWQMTKVLDPAGPRT